MNLAVLTMGGGDAVPQHDIFGTCIMLVNVKQIGHAVNASNVDTHVRMAPTHGGTRGGSLNLCRFVLAEILNLK